MALPAPVGKYWVSTVTLPVSREGNEWYGRWFIYDCQPDLEENAEAHPLAEGVTSPFLEERDASIAARIEGRRAALAMNG